MSDLTTVERLRIEKLFGMGSGYVMGFTNRIFQEFVLEKTGIDIYAKKYDYSSGSKANRLRSFFKQESNYLVGKLIGDLLEYWIKSQQMQQQEIPTQDAAMYNECLRIAERLKADVSMEEVEYLQPNSPEKDFNLLAKSIRESIQKNEPEAALDRLHTFVVKYVRRICLKHNIDSGKGKPLHSLFGEYVKHLNETGKIKSQMTERILKYSISILEAFNDVRNKQSFAHDNPILNYNESILIFNHIFSLIRFIESIKNATSEPQQKPTEKADGWEDNSF